MFSAKDLRCTSLETSVLGKDVGGSRFMVKVSSAQKFKGGWVEDEGKVGNTCSRNLQFVNLA